MNFGELKAAVNTSSGPRDDIPAHIYDLVLTEINRSLRTLKMLESASIQVGCCTTAEIIAGTCTCEYTALPADYLEMESAYILSGGTRCPVLPLYEENVSLAPTSQSARYSITNDGIRLERYPDAEVALNITYYKANAALSADADTNVALLNYPDVYLYLSLAHAALWARDMEGAAAYRSQYEASRMNLSKSDRMSRVAGPLVAQAGSVA